MANLTSVTAVTLPASRFGPFAVMFIGVLLAFGGGASSCCLGAMTDGVAGLFMLFLFGVVGSGILVAGLFWHRSIKDIHVVRITTAGGQADALASHDYRHIEAVVNAVNHALIRRG